MNVFFSQKNNYNADETFTDLLKLTLRTNRNPTPVTTVNILYMKGASETISRILQPYNIRVAHKPTTKTNAIVTNTIHLTLKMTSAKVVETSVTKNSSFENYSQPDDHNIHVRTNNTVVLEREVGSILNFSGA